MIKVVNLYKSFNVNGKEIGILNNINFSLPDHGMYFIYGNSGCGKSTLLNILEGILSPTKGKVYVNNVDLYSLKEKEKNAYYQSFYGILFQNFNLFEDLTIKENLEIALKVKGIKNDKIMGDLLKKYKLFKQKDQLVFTLSGGEKQRVALIRSLINNPSIIFADEPTGALDIENSYLLMEQLKELSKEKLVIIVSHNNKLVNEYNDGILYLENGNLLFESKENETKKVEIKNLKTISFISLFFKKEIKKERKQIIYSFISLIIGFLFIFFSNGFIDGYSNNKSNFYSSYVDSNIFSINKYEYKEINSSKLNLIKKIRPKEDFLNTYFSFLDSYEICDDLSYFVSGKVLINGEEKSDVEYGFYYENSSDNKIIVNDKLKSEFKIGSIYNFEFKKNLKTYSIKSDDYFYDDFSYNSPFIISQSINELSFASSKKLYLPYLYFFDCIKDYELVNLSNEEGKVINVYEAICNANDYDEITSYSRLLIVNNNEVDNLISIIQKNEEIDNPILKINTSCFTKVNSFIEIMDSLSLGFYFFIGIILISNCFLISFLIYSSINKSKRDIAIFKILGLRNDDLNNLYLSKNLFIVIISILVGFLMYLLTKSLLNNFLSSFFVINNMIGFNLRNILFILLISLLFFIFSIYFPLNNLKKVDIAKELKEE